MDNCAVSFLKEEGFYQHNIKHYFDVKALTLHSKGQQ